MRLNELNHKIYLDLDGVMSDLVGMWASMTPYTRHEIDTEYTTNRELKREVWRATKSALKKGTQVWYNLDLMPDALELWNYIKRFDVEILTACGRTHTKFIGRQKERWVADHLSPSVPVNLVRDGIDKAAYTEPGAILIDDQAKNIHAWEEQGGIGILHTSAQATIRKLQQLGL